MGLPAGNRVSMIWKLLPEDRPWASDATRHTWETLLGQEITKEKWQEICLMQSIFTKSRRFQIFVWKCLHKYFYTPSRLAIMFPGHFDACWRCTDGARGDWLHIFYGCPELGAFKLRLQEILKSFVPTMPTFTPQLHFLGPAAVGYPLS